MEKRYQVFVSSTFWDLEDERQEVMQALLEQDCMPSGMELFPATNDDQWSLIKKVIDDSDYYIVVVAGRYGSIGPSGQSYTEMEYRYALETGKPILGFVHRNIQDIPAKFSETDLESKEKLKSFHELVKQKLCKLWDSPAELGGHVSRSLIKLTKSNPAVGWVRANLVPDESAAKEILSLRRRIDELEKEVASASINEPKDSADLARGEDEFDFTYDFISSFGHWDRINHFASSTITWDEIFSAVSPIMMNEASDAELRIALNSVAVELCLVDHEGKEEFKGRKLESIEVWEDDFHTIKIQLRSLGLITQSVKNRHVQDVSTTYWTLTPYGDTVMTRLRAIKRTPLQVV
jgi:hypothetical protein